MAELVATAYSPGTVGNVAVGFDLLGHCISGIGDRVTARRESMRSTTPMARIGTIKGVVSDLPIEPARNTASRAVQALLDEIQPSFDVVLDLEKGIPLCSGLGGSAASATAALIATNALLDDPLEKTQLYPFALHGESIASASMVGDNVGPQLLGGLTLATSKRLISLPVPKDLYAVVIHPHVSIETVKARECLKTPFELASITSQQSGLAQLLVGLYTNDDELIREGLVDHLIEPRRANQIIGFDRVKQTALACGALGASISGAGPTVFAWFRGQDRAKRAIPTLKDAFAHDAVETTAYLTPVNAAGARLE